MINDFRKTPAGLCRASLALVLTLCMSVLAACQTMLEGYRAYGPRASDEDAAFAAGAGLPPSARTMHAMARLMAAQGSDAQSSFTLARIIREHPRFAPAYNDLAEIHLRQNQVDEAVKVLAGGIHAVPDDPVLLNNLGMCHVLKADYATALVYFDSAVHAAPNEPRYISNLATALGMLGRYDDALAAYRKVVPAGEAHYNLAVLCRARLDVQRADDETRRAEQFGFKEQAAVEAPVPQE